MRFHTRSQIYCDNKRCVEDDDDNNNKYNNEANKEAANKGWHESRILEIDKSRQKKAKQGEVAKVKKKFEYKKQDKEMMIMMMRIYFVDKKILCHNIESNDIRDLKRFNI